MKIIRNGITITDTVTGITTTSNLFTIESLEDIKTLLNIRCTCNGVTESCIECVRTCGCPADNCTC